jgi:exodeoxyribonuclease X
VSAIIFDTETTDAVDGELIEAASQGVELIDGLIHPIAGAGVVARYKPSKSISFGAMATHHILDEDLVDCAEHHTFELPAGTKYLIAHNVDFDWRVIGEPNVKRICTLAMARKQYPTLDSHRLGALMYHLSTDRARTREELREAHSAFADIAFCFQLLQAICIDVGGFESFEHIWQFSEEARVPTVMTFGKHKGLAIEDVPRDYVQWLLRQPDLDPYLRRAFER